MIVWRILMVFSGTASTSVERLMHDLSWNKPSSVAVVVYSWRLSEACSRDLHLLQTH